MKPARATEAQCERAIIQAAQMAGWRVHGERTSRTKDGGYLTAVKGTPGFPDLTLVRGSQLWFVELKRAPNKIEPEQDLWLDALGNVPGVRALVVWVPEQQEQFIKALQRKT